MERLVDPSKPIEVRIFGAKDPKMNHNWRDAEFDTPSVAEVRMDDGKIEKWVKSVTGEIWYEGQKVGEVRNKGVKEEAKEEAPRHSYHYFKNGSLEYHGDREHFSQDMEWLWLRTNVNMDQCVRTVRISKELNKQLMIEDTFCFKIEVIDPVYIAGEPPLGLTPKTIWQTMRKEQILDAMKRYAKEGKTIPKAWIEELEELND